jgi:hypothetical protein
MKRLHAVFYAVALILLQAVNLPAETLYTVTIDALRAPDRVARLQSIARQCRVDPTQSVAVCSVTEEQLREVARKGYHIAKALIVPGSASAAARGETLVATADDGLVPLATLYATSFVDTDGDAMDDAWEIQNFGDLSHDGNADNDAVGPAGSPGNPVPGPDGVTDLWEYRWGTNPNHFDSDGDNVSDGAEIAALRAGDHGHGPPFLGWPSADRDRDGDCIPDLVEELLLGLNSNRESTDGDKYDDGQEFFGITEIGRGGMPRAVDSDYLSSSMPNWVDPPGNHWFMAAYPDLKITLQSDTFTIIPRTQIESGERSISEQERTYACTTVRINTATATETQSLDVSYPTRRGVRALTQKGYAKVLSKSGSGALPVASTPTGDQDYTTEKHLPSRVARKFIAAKGATPKVQSKDAWLGSSWKKQQKKDAGQQMRIERRPHEDALSDPDSDAPVADQEDMAKNTKRRPPQPDADSATPDSDRQRRKPPSALMAEADGTDLEGTVLSHDADPQNKAQRASEAGINDSVRVGEVSSSYEQTAASTTSRFFRQDEWWSVTAQDTHHAADLRFSLKIRNEGTDVCREITRILVNFYIGNDADPAYSVDLLEGHTSLSNIFPEDEINFASFHDIPLTLDQLRRVDLGEPIRLLVERIEYGDDQIFYEDAFAGGVMFKIDDGVADGQEEIDKYLMPTWGTETYQDVLRRAEPVLSFETSPTGDITAVTVPQFDSQHRVASQTRLPVTPGTRWTVRTQTLHTTPPPFREVLAMPETSVHVVYDTDSDGDGYTDRAELRAGTDCGDPASHPAPDLRAAYVETHDATWTNYTRQMVIENVGNWPAYGIQCQMYAPSSTVHVLNNLVGAGGVLEPGQRVIIGPAFETTLSGWTGTSEPEAVGVYEGAEDVRFTFAADASGTVGWTTNLTLSWWRSDDHAISNKINVGKGYCSPNLIEVADGLCLRFPSGASGSSFGSINAGETFSVLARTAKDVFRYCAPPIASQALAVAHYEFEGSTADRSGNGYDLTAAAGAGYDPGGQSGEAYVMQPRIGNHLVASGLSLGGSVRTLELWVKPTTLPTNHQTLIWLSDENSTSNSLEVYYETNQLSLKLILDNSVRRHLSGGTLTTGQWQQVVVTCGSSWIRLYVNGSQRSPTVTDTATPVASMTKLRLGSELGSLNGLIDHVALFAAQLSPTDVFNFYNNGNGRTLPLSPPVYTPPVVLISYNDQQGNWRQVVDLQIKDAGGTLDLPGIRLRPKIPAPRISIHSRTQYDYGSANALYVSLFNGGPVIQNSRLFVEYVSATGSVLQSESATINLPRGPERRTFSFTPSLYSAQLATGARALALVTLVDHEGNVIDMASHVFQAGVAGDQYRYGGKLQLSASALAFGTVKLGQTPMRTLVLANTGTNPLEVAVSSENPALQTSLPAGPVVLRPAETTPVSVWIDTARLGTGSSNLNLRLMSSAAGAAATVPVTVTVQSTPTNLVEAVQGYPWRKRIILASACAPGTEVVISHGLGDSALVQPLYAWDSYEQLVATADWSPDESLVPRQGAFAGLRKISADSIGVTLANGCPAGESITVSFGKGLCDQAYQSDFAYTCSVEMATQNVSRVNVGYATLTPLTVLDDFSYGADSNRFFGTWAVTGTPVISFGPDHVTIREGAPADYAMRTRGISRTREKIALHYSMANAADRAAVQVYWGTNRLGQQTVSGEWIGTYDVAAPGSDLLDIRMLRSSGLDTEWAFFSLLLGGVGPEDDMRSLGLLRMLSVAPQGDPTPLFTVNEAVGRTALGRFSMPLTQIASATGGVGWGQATVSVQLTARTSLLPQFDLAHLLLTDPSLSYGSGSLADLSLAQLSVSASGSNALVSAAVANTGGADARHFAIAFYNGDPAAGGVYIGTAFMTNTVVAGTTNLVTFSWMPTSGIDPAGIFAVIDPHDLVEEGNKDNNIWPGSALMPDLRVASVQFTPAHPVRDADVTLAVRVENCGSAAASNVLVEAYYRNPQTLPVIGSNLVSLLPGTNATVLLTWHPTEAGPYVVTAHVDRAAARAELVETNNMFAAPVLVSLDRRYVDCGATSDMPYPH